MHGGRSGVGHERSRSEGERAGRTAAAVDALRQALIGAHATAADAAERERQARQELVLANAEVPAYNARRYRNSDEPMEELVQTAYLGLVKAANGYLPDRGHDFLARRRSLSSFSTRPGRTRRHVDVRRPGWPRRRCQPASTLRRMSGG